MDYIVKYLDVEEAKTILKDNYISIDIPFDICYTIQSDKLIKSFMLISKKPDIIKLNTVYEIEYIYTKDKYRNMGYANMLIDHIKYRNIVKVLYKNCGIIKSAFSEFTYYNGSYMFYPEFLTEFIKRNNKFIKSIEYIISLEHFKNYTIFPVEHYNVKESDFEELKNKFEINYIDGIWIVKLNVNTLLYFDYNNRYKNELFYSILLNIKYKKYASKLIYNLILKNQFNQIYVPFIKKIAFIISNS